MKFDNSKKLISFDDVLLVPQYSDIVSRSEIDTSVKMADDIQLQIPIISSPMSTITESHMCNALRWIGGLGIIHRYNTIDFQAKLLGFVGGDKNYKQAFQEIIKKDYLNYAESVLTLSASMLRMGIIFLLKMQLK